MVDTPGKCTLCNHWEVQFALALLLVDVAPGSDFAGLPAPRLLGPISTSLQWSKVHLHIMAPYPQSPSFGARFKEKSIPL